MSSVCSSLESWSHGFFALELSREIATVSLWEVLSVYVLLCCGGSPLLNGFLLRWSNIEPSFSS